MPVYLPPIPQVPGRVRPTSFVISPYGPEGSGIQLMMNGTVTAPATAVWPTGSLAIGFPFVVTQPVTATLLAAFNGSAVSGNVDMGIYDDAGTRLVSIGATAQSGTNAIQSFNITDTPLSPSKRYYLLQVRDNTTGASFRQTHAAAVLSSLGWVQVASAYPLPSSVTFAAMGSAYLPAMGLSTTSVI
jgi:hypothetical protein